jgi:hypothetical protein
VEAQQLMSELILGTVLMNLPSLMKALKEILLGYVTFPEDYRKEG